MNFSRKSVWILQVWQRKSGHIRRCRMGSTTLTLCGPPVAAGHGSYRRNTPPRQPLDRRLVIPAPVPAVSCCTLLSLFFLLAELQPLCSTTLLYTRDRCSGARLSSRVKMSEYGTGCALYSARRGHNESRLDQAPQQDSARTERANTHPDEHRAESGVQRKGRRRGDGSVRRRGVLRCHSVRGRA